MPLVERPLSVMRARDPEVLQDCLDFYAPDGAHVLDCTANHRRMWTGVRWAGPITYMDIDPTVNPDVTGDFRAMPFAAESFDVVVFDPPHLPVAAASRASLPQYVTDYGLQQAPKADNVSALIRAFLPEARRVLRNEGIIIAKLKDYVHNHRYQWMLVEWVNAVGAVEGLTACDLRIKQDPCGGNLKSGRWQRVHHARNAHTWFAIVRKGRCEPKGKG